MYQLNGKRGGVVLVTLLSCIFVLLFIVTPSQGAQDDKDLLNVFVIPHSHCDPGWLNTFEGYFRAQVNRILTNVVSALLVDSAKKFVWAEISFFQMWYDQQNLDTRDAVFKLVKKGQLEFVAGGWVQNDEANANFDIVIDQITEGHEFLHRTFGVVPRVGWQIDPFGHSSLTPSLFARIGFEAVVINRIHYNLKNSFKNNQQMEFIWQGSRSLGNESEIFTHVLHTHYSAPKGYDWEEGSTTINANNVDYQAKGLVSQLKSRASSYRTNNLLVPFGDDFKFQDANRQFTNMDALIKHINSRKGEFGVNIQYSTVSQYFDAVFKTSKEKKTVFPRYEGDFFPYADNADAYWTGYYTTRPYLKGHSRSTDSHLKAAEGLYAIGRSYTSSFSNQNTTVEVDVNWSSLFDDIIQARRDAALVQHHDGITGTAKSFVAGDYAARLDAARNTARRTIKRMMQVLLTDRATPDLYDKIPLNFGGDEQGVYALVVHNPLGWTRRKFVSVVVSSQSVSVSDNTGIIIPSQIMPIWDTNTGEISTTQYELFFMAEVLPLALRTYFVSKSNDPLTAAFSYTFYAYSNIREPETVELGAEEMTIENDHITVIFSNKTGLIESVINKDDNISLPVQQQLIDYSTGGRGSGAYIFRPAGQAPVYGDKEKKRVNIVKGSLVSQACVYYMPTNSKAVETSVCAKLYTSRAVIDPQAVLEVGGYVQINYNVIGRGNKETVARYTTSLNTQGTFYTDNGLEIRGRKTSGTTQADFYPNLSVAYISDTSTQLTLVSRQAMGTSSPTAGGIEQMLHRNLKQDDIRGLGEPNNDDSRINVQVLLMVQPVDVSAKIARRLALALQHYPRIMIGTTTSRTSWTNQYKTTYEPMATQLPPNTHLLSLKARDGVSDDVIIRFAHIFETSQHPIMSKPSEIKWDKLFKSWDVDTKRERSLAITMDTEVANARKPRFEPSKEMLSHESGLTPVFGKKGESQNTDEEGVFISQASLDDKKKVEEGLNRKLLSLDDVILDNKKIVNRKLLALDDVSSIDPSLILHPMQIKSFLVHLNKKNVQFKTGVVSPDTIIPAGGKPAPTEEVVGTTAVEPKEKHDLSVTEVKWLLVLSVLCTGLMIVAYTRLRKTRADKKKEGNYPQKRTLLPV